MELLPIGTRVYRKGDMANNPGYGEVVSHRSLFTMDIKMDNGHLLKGIRSLSFEGVIPSFQTVEQRKAERLQQLKEVHCEVQANHWKP